MTVTSAALVGTVGGGGTTRLAVELGAAFARAGRRALVLDLDFDTQGLASRVPGRLSPDSTQLLTDPSIDLDAATHDVPLDAPGTLALCPAHAPFTRVADAKAPDAAQRLDDRLTEAAVAGYDAVLVDTPPIASNPAVAAVTATDRTALVASPDERGVDAIQRARGRLADVGANEDLVVTTAASAPTPEADLPDADHAIPVAPTTSPETNQADPDALGDGPFPRAVVETTESLFETDLGIEFEPASRIDAVREKLS